MELPLPSTAQICLTPPVRVINLLPVNSKLTLFDFSVKIQLGLLNVSPLLVGTTVLPVGGTGETPKEEKGFFCFLVLMYSPSRLPQPGRPPNTSLASAEVLVTQELCTLRSSQSNDEQPEWMQIISEPEPSSASASLVCSILAAISLL